MQVEHLLGRLAPWHDLFVESLVRGAAVVDVLRVKGATQWSHSHVYVHIVVSSSCTRSMCACSGSLFRYPDFAAKCDTDLSVDVLVLVNLAKISQALQLLHLHLKEIVQVLLVQRRPLKHHTIYHGHWTLHTNTGAARESGTRAQTGIGGVIFQVPPVLGLGLASTSTVPLRGGLELVLECFLSPRGLQSLQKHDEYSEPTATSRGHSTRVDTGRGHAQAG